MEFHQFFGNNNFQTNQKNIKIEMTHNHANTSQL